MTVDIAAYLRWGSLPCRVALEQLRSMPIGGSFSSFFLSLWAGCSREKKESETISADVLWICWSRRALGRSGALPAMPWNAVNWLYTVVVALLVVVVRFPRNETG